MKKHYTMLEALEVLEFGEVMVKVGGMTEDNKPKSLDSYYVSRNGEACFFDENDNGILKNYKNKRNIMMAKPFNKSDSNLFVIMSKEVYDKIQNG